MDLTIVSLLSLLDDAIIGIDAVALLFERDSVLPRRLASAEGHLRGVTIVYTIPERWLELSHFLCA